MNKKARSSLTFETYRVQGTRSESQRYLDELDSSKQALIQARHERDQVMLSLKQKKMEADKSAEEARNARAKEEKLQSELERLRNHLVQVCGPEMVGCVVV